MLENQKANYKELNFYEGKVDYFEVNVPHTKESLELLKYKEWVKFKRGLNLATVITFIGCIFTICGLVFGELSNDNLIKYFLMVGFPVFLIAFFCCLLCMIEKSSIKNDLNNALITFEENEKCRAFSKLPGMENVAQYMQKVDALGRNLTNKEHHEIITQWKKVVELKKELNFKGN